MIFIMIFLNGEFAEIFDILNADFQRSTLMISFIIQIFEYFIRYNIW